MARRSKNSLSDDQPDLFDLAAVSVPAASLPVLNLESEPELRRHFLGWDRSLVRAAAKHIAAGWDGTGALDLSGMLIIVPTRNAGRRLREALAMHAAEKNAAVLPPRVVTPDFLTSPERIAEVQAADRVQTLLIWAAEMMRLDFAAHRHLFPIDPVERGFTWALKTAGDLLELRETLNEKGLSIADVAREFADSDREPDRWADLAKIERQCVRVTEQSGLADWQATRRRAARQGVPPPDISRVVMAGVLDPSALALEALKRWSSTLPVEILIHAPQRSHADFYDAFGRPLVEAWLTQPIDIPSPEATIHVAGTPAEQAEAAVELLAAHGDPGSIAALGVADAEIAAPLEKTLAARGIDAFDPAGRRMSTHGVFYLLRVLSQLAATRSFRAVMELVRCPDVTDTIQRIVTGPKPSLKALLDDFDRLAIESLPDTLDDALELAPRVFSSEKRRASAVPAALAWMNDVLDSLSGANFATGLTTFLATVFEEREFRANRPQDAVFAEIAKQITEVLDTLEGPAVARFPAPLDAANKLELLLLVLNEQVFYPDRKARDIDLQGWLELLWEDAPHLVITGMNDGKAPEAILGHAFLPDSARRALDLRHNDTRFARDASLMTALIESRRHGGRVDFIFGRTGTAEEPLRPSRLLFQCPDAELPARTLHFFKKPLRHVDPMPWQLAWRLRPEPLPDDATIFHKLSVTQFRAYLMCPFRFYLRHGLRMEEIDTSCGEMDHMEFGSLMHAVLEEFANDPAASTATDPHVIRAAFHAILDRKLHGLYGPRLTVPVTIQRESARQRLGWWAEFEAQERRKGWRIEAAETRISPDDDPWTFAGMTISGIVDRVERHAQFGVRLIDFKTSSPYDSLRRARRTVEEYHIAKLKRSEDPATLPAWLLTHRSNGDASRWTDLQLPLYRLAMERRFPGVPITTAHVTLGKTKADIGLDPWPELEGRLLESARACAEGVIAAIRERVFWPPAAKLPFSDEFGHLFFGEPLEAVDAELITGLPRSPASSPH
jgi:ATP-dependent helicase/nuclease subunit B